MFESIAPFKILPAFITLLVLRDKQTVSNWKNNTAWCRNFMCFSLRISTSECYKKKKWDTRKPTKRNTSRATAQICSTLFTIPTIRGRGRNENSRPSISSCSIVEFPLTYLCWINSSIITFLDVPISSRRDVWLIFTNTLYLAVNENYVDPDQTPQNAASDLDLHRLLMSLNGR